jgi:hypothetical protein
MRHVSKAENDQEQEDPSRVIGNRDDLKGEKFRVEDYRAFLILSSHYLDPLLILHASSHTPAAIV